MSDKPYDSRPDTEKHIMRVQGLLGDAIQSLRDRASQHDWSKLHDPERTVFDAVTPALKGLTYGSDEYKAQLKFMGVALDHHYENNRHHPEHTYSHENWRSIPGYATLYEVSDLGRIRSLTRTVKRENQGDMRVDGKLRIDHVTPKGYCRLQLKDENGIAKNHFVHVIVTLAFLGSPEDNQQVNHKNGIKSDNSVLNLEYVTPSQNLNHAYDTGLRDPAVKYVVHCIEEDIVTFGTDKMEKELRAIGHIRVRSSGIWRCVTSDGDATHQDLTFESWPIAEYKEMHSPVNGMTLIDLIEMVCDWKAATERHDNGDIMKSLVINAERFGISEQLAKILENTVRDPSMGLS